MITEVATNHIPRDLLLLADPHEPSIDGYLETGIKLGYYIDNQIEGVLVASEEGRTLEIKNLAVYPHHQGHGLGTALVKHLQRLAKGRGCAEVLVGTGNSSLDQLAFYQKRGFRIDSVKEDYFREYEPEIYEHGIRCLDLVVLKWMCKDS